MAALAREPCTTRDLLERNAVRWPQAVVLRFDTGEVYSNQAFLTAVRRRAAALQQLGVGQGELVLSWLPNGPVAVLTWLALNYIGAVVVPINIAYKGSLLQHVIHSSRAVLMIAQDDLLVRLQDIDTGSLRCIVAVGGRSASPSGVALLDAQHLEADESLLQALPRTIAAEDTQCVIFTSGTTGPSKGVLCSYRHTWRAALEFRHVGPGDTNLVALPMFHIGGVLGVNFALIHGGCAAVIERFRTSTFWENVRSMQVTSAGLLGVMVQFLLQQPVQAGEREHPLRRVVIAPYGDEALLFAERFGVEIYTEFNMTELSVPLWCGPNVRLRGTCGRPREGVELRLVDGLGKEVETGTVGQLLVRTPDPYEISHGYLNDAEATAHSFRDGWFHTGDLFRRDADDNWFFVDRAKDMIRRRGENISSFEVEAELLQFPGVTAAAAVPVPGDGGEDEVLAVLVTEAAGSAAAQQAEWFSRLVAFLEPRMAAFMVPRYFRLVEHMPLTPTQKIEKHVLRAQALTPDTWDRKQSTP